VIGCIQLATPDEAALRALRLRLDRLSPRVQLDQGARETILLLDLGRGTLRDARRHAAALSELLSGGGSARAAIAPTPTLATLAARRSEEAPLIVAPGGVGSLLARCPIGWVAPLIPHELVLHGLGLRSLADVAALPAAAVGGRFGSAALGAWRALHGDEPPLTPLPLRPRLGAKRSLEGSVADQGALGLALSRLAARLGAALARRGVQARSLVLHLQGDDGPWSASRVLEHPAADGATLAPIAAGLLRAAGASSGVETLTLLVGELVPTRGEQLSLFASATAQREAAQLALADLAARLAPGSLLQATAAPAGSALAESRGHLTAWGVQ
jgi:protein ImuB